MNIILGCINDGMEYGTIQVPSDKHVLHRLQFNFSNILRLSLPACYGVAELQHQWNFVHQKFLRIEHKSGIRQQRTGSC